MTMIVADFGRALLAIALLLTVTLLPVVRWLESHRVPHLLAVAICFLFSFLNPAHERAVGEALASIDWADR